MQRIFLTHNGDEELSTTISLWESKASSVWGKKNPTPYLIRMKKQSSHVPKGSGYQRERNNIIKVAFYGKSYKSYKNYKSYKSYR